MVLFTDTTGRNFFCVAAFTCVLYTTDLNTVCDWVEDVNCVVISYVSVEVNLSLTTRDMN